MTNIYNVIYLDYIKTFNIWDIPTELLRNFLVDRMRVFVAGLGGDTPAARVLLGQLVG